MLNLHAGCKLCPISRVFNTCFTGNHKSQYAADRIACSHDIKHFLCLSFKKLIIIRALKKQQTILIKTNHQVIQTNFFFQFFCSPKNVISIVERKPNCCFSFLAIRFYEGKVLIYAVICSTFGITYNGYSVFFPA